MRDQKFTKYIIEANRKAKKYKFYINNSVHHPTDSKVLDVYDINNNYENRIIITDSEIELYTEPIEETGMKDDLEDFYMRHYVR